MGPFGFVLLCSWLVGVLTAMTAWMVSLGEPQAAWIDVLAAGAVVGICFMGIGVEGVEDGPDV